MRRSGLAFHAALPALVLMVVLACRDDDGSDSNSAAGSSLGGGKIVGDGGRGGFGGDGAATGGASDPAGVGGAGGSASSARSGSGGSPDSVRPDDGGRAGGAASLGPCGDSERGGVRVTEDVTAAVVWDCPVYTLTKPIFVYSTSSARAKLTIAPGTIIHGEAGDLDRQILPGALIVTRTGIIEAIGTPSFPIVFTSANPVGHREPGDWGGVVLLGRGPTNVPGDLDSAGNSPGEMFIEGLPRTDEARVLYGAPIVPARSAGGASGMGGESGSGGENAGAGGNAGDPRTDSDLVNTGDPEWSCGRLEYVRIEFPGFEVAQGRELNGLTLAGCGRGTVVENVQVHQSSDDGIELFGGTVDLKRVVITGVKDDGLDWDQGYRGRMQFVAIQMHDDTLLPSEGKGDSGIEADGYASPSEPFERPSNARIYNLTLIASTTSQRGVRLREGTQAQIRNAILVAAPNGATSGLIDIGDVQTADFLTASELVVESSIFFGTWPASGQKDSAGTLYIEADYFTADRGVNSNREARSLESVLPGALDESNPGWVPPASSLATDGAAEPIDGAGLPSFYESDARYLGAFEPGGTDWSRGWTAYPRN